MAELAPIAELFLYLALLISTIYALIYSYHWFNYGESRRINWLALIVFLVGTGILLLVMFLTLISN